MSNQYGWICPRCGKVNAPWMPACDCKYADMYTPQPPLCPSSPVGYQVITCDGTSGQKGGAK